MAKGIKPLLDKKKIIDEYNSGISLTSLRDKYCTSFERIRDLIKDDVSFRTKTECARKYNINDNYFNTISNEKQAYILGFICADGNITNPKASASRINIVQKADDSKILSIISKEFYNDNIDHVRIYNSPIDKRTNKIYHKAELNIDSKPLRDRLIDLGIGPAKSLTLEYPVSISSLNMDLQRHFIRGYYDGDGGLNNNQIAISGTKEFLNHLMIITTKELCINSSIRKDGKREINTYRMYIQGRLQSLKFCNWIYKDATIYLDRKYNRYLEINY